MRVGDAGGIEGGELEGLEEGVVGGRRTSHAVRRSPPCGPVSWSPTSVRARQTNEMGHRLQRDFTLSRVLQATAPNPPSVALLTSHILDPALPQQCRLSATTNCL